MHAVGLAIDHRNVVPALVTLTSLADALEPAARRALAVRVIGQDLARAEVETMRSVCGRVGFGDFDHRRVQPASMLIRHGAYITPATYLRLAFDAPFVGRPHLLYLDADVLVADDPLGAGERVPVRAIGAARDMLNHTVGEGHGLPGLVDAEPSFAGRSYVNAGVLYIPAPMLPTFSRSVVRALGCDARYIHFNDQDALNLWLLRSDSLAELPAEVNVIEIGRFLATGDWVARVLREAAPRTPRIVHFVGPLKPWLRSCPSTPWVVEYRSALARVERILGRIGDRTLAVPR
jgi:lipopolysaccharide biosynthesis glycosyltransferase